MSDKRVEVYYYSDDEESIPLEKDDLHAIIEPKDDKLNHVALLKEITEESDLNITVSFSIL